MHPELTALFDRQSGVATIAQIRSLVSRRHLLSLVDCGAVERIWQGIYSRGGADTSRRLRGLDLAHGETLAICLNTAAAAYGFDIEDSSDLHVLNPSGHQIRSTDGLVVHRRTGAPITELAGRPTTTPGWTAVELARTLPRPRALATLDAALHSGACDVVDLTNAVAAQRGRRGVVGVRGLLGMVDGRAESPMESEARLVMSDGGLPTPELQYEIIDARGHLRRLDFAWPGAMLAAEYDSDRWHNGSDAMRRDREKVAAVQELGWTVIPIVAGDVRRRPAMLVSRINSHLRRAYAA